VRLSDTVTTLITWSTVGCIIRMATIATTTGLCPSFHIKSRSW
jgi:hypothetical protein